MKKSKLIHRKKKENELSKKFFDDRISEVFVSFTAHRFQSKKKGKSGCRLASLEMIF